MINSILMYLGVRYMWKLTLNQDNSCESENIKTWLFYHFSFFLVCARVYFNECLPGKYMCECACVCQRFYFSHLGLASPSSFHYPHTVDKYIFFLSCYHRCVNNEVGIGQGAKITSFFFIALLRMRRS